MHPPFQKPSSKYSPTKFEKVATPMLYSQASWDRNCKCTTLLLTRTLGLVKLGAGPICQSSSHGKSVGICPLSTKSTLFSLTLHKTCSGSSSCFWACVKCVQIKNILVCICYLIGRAYCKLYYEAVSSQPVIYSTWKIIPR
jgi:hypothetical protein